MWGFFERKPESDPSVLTFLDFDENLETRVPGLFVAGDITGYPLLKISINQAHDLVERLAADRPEPPAEDVWDLAVVGAGAAGLSAAKTARARGLRCVVLEGDRPAAAIHNFHRGKILLAEPVAEPVRGPLWFEECTREQLLEKWAPDLAGQDLNIESGVMVEDVRRGPDGVFTLTGRDGRAFRAMRVIMAPGRQGDARKLGVPGEDRDKVAYRLFDPAVHHGKEILVAGAGDQAAETALALCGHNSVTLAVRGAALTRPRKPNIRALERAVAEKKLTILFETTVREIRERTVLLRTPDGDREIPNHEVIINAGARPPYPFLEKIGIRVADAWTPRRKALLAAFLAFITAVYVFKVWGEDALLARLGFASAAHIPNPALAFVARQWYGMLYTGLVLGFGAWILMRPRARHYRLRAYVRNRTLSCMFFQSVFLFALPAVPAPWLGAKAASLVTVWPLTLMPAGFANRVLLLGDTRPEVLFYAAFTAFLAFIAMPVFVYFHGKRYCAWVCGCGALAETFGEPFRRLAPKGLLNRRRERIIYLVLAASMFMTGVLVLRQAFVPRGAAAAIQFWYNLVVYTLFSGVIGVGLYPFFGGRMWCRYFCPLAAYMNLLGAVWSRYQISSNDRCIDCAQCNRYCEMGIDIKGFALRQQPFTVRNTPCVGCGECIAVCPMNVLAFGPRPPE